jgi:hypothetical protein
MSPVHLKALQISEWAYRTALLAYPASYRARFAPEMLCAFRELNAEAVGVSGIRGGLRLWWREATGVVRTAVRERVAAVGSTTASAAERRVGGVVRAAGRSVWVWACAVFVFVLAAYVWTLAPTVTFWDAGEFLAASKTLGVPHPPGTPVWVFVSHVWATLVPFGAYAFRVNLMTAVFSAAAAAFLFLVVHAALSRTDGKDTGLWSHAGAAAAVIVSAFTFTVWQNSNEAEVYAIAAFSIAATTWFAMVWRSHRGTPKATRMLFLMVYLGAFSIGNHLLALLVGPALVGFMWHVLRTEPLTDQKARNKEWTQWAVLTATWVLLIATGLGSPALLGIAAVVFVGATTVAGARGSLRFPVAMLAVSAVGVSTYLFLYIRAAQVPFLNMWDPSTLDALLSVIRREQYPPRLPTDNPLYLSGEGNPGRTFGLLWLQILNYLQYFDWQWAMGLKPNERVFALGRLPFTLVFTSLGIYGASLLRQRDRSAFWLLLSVFVVTGPGLVGYMNFKPGFSLGLEQYPVIDMHEVRERDYFFLVSFQVWGLFAGVGIVGMCRSLRASLGQRWAGKRWAPHLAFPLLALALIPPALNFKAASRSHGPQVQLARDYAYDVLQTIEPYGILITHGDNDTYPLWYLQAVEGIRPDVTVMVGTLSRIPSYIRHLRDRPVQPFDPEQAPWFADSAPAVPPPPVHSLTDAEIASLRPMALPTAYTFRAGVIEHTYPAGTPLYVNDLLLLRMIQENVGKRSVYFSGGGGDEAWVRLGDSVVQEGLALKLYADKHPDAAQVVDSGFGYKVNLERTESLAWNVYRYADLLETDTPQLDSNHRPVIGQFAQMYLSLAQAHDTVGNRERSIQNLLRAYHFLPTPQLRRIVDAVAPGRIPSDATMEPE